jgi:CheY-like chemotaxis protein
MNTIEQDRPALVRSGGAANAKSSRAANPLAFLVAEDYPANRDFTRRLLEKRGHQVVVVEDGQQALEAWRNGRFDVILMDLQMPKMDGRAAAGLIRAEEHARGADHVSIIGLTAHSERRVSQERLARSMDACLTKPLRREQIVDFIEKLANREEVEPRSAPEQPCFCLEKLEERCGHNPKTQRRVLELCQDVLEAKLPEVRQAREQCDRRAFQKLAHSLRGTLGFLESPVLMQLSQDVEYGYESLGEELWNKRCVEFHTLLERLRDELRRRPAA